MMQNVHNFAAELFPLQIAHFTDLSAKKAGPSTT